MEQMSITKALSELKLLDKRITKKINYIDFIATAKKSSNKINGAIDKKDFQEDAKKDHKSILDLIERRKKIKSAIVKSNAEENVEINGKKMTRAEAIERKNNIQYEINFLNAMKTQLNSVIAQNNMHNESVQDRLDRMLEASLGRDAKQKSSPEDIEAIAKPFLEQNEWEIIDPLGLKEKIEKMEKEIDGFLSEVDFILSESNATSKIYIK